jgi:hypothetical protein
VHSLSGGLVLGYHGCDAAVGEKLLAGEPFSLSANTWDWLGPGAYFWEANPKRGFDFASELKARKYKHNRIDRPFVVGAVINLGLCLDLTTKAGIDIVLDAHRRLIEIYAKAERPPPLNAQSLLQRDLDCAVIEQVHIVREERAAAPIDTVKGVFIEGPPVYLGSGFFEKTHIQIAVRNLNCIKGVFRVSPNLYE